MNADVKDWSGHLRAIWRLIALGLVTSFMYILRLSVMPLALLPGARSRRISDRIGSRIFRWWARMAAAILGLRLHVEGPRPAAPFFLAANHLSYLDIVALATQIDATFVAKKEVKSWPVIGLLSRSVNTRFVDRTRRSDLTRVIDVVQRDMAAGRGVVVFPEGTSTKGAEVLPFKASLFQAPLAAGVPVATASLSYATPEGSPPAWLSVCWWGDMTFFKHVIELMRLPSIEASITFGPILEADVAGQSRKDLALRAHDAVRMNFRPVCANRTDALEHGAPAICLSENS